ncbi:hypothetical protein BurJ1DRAFT_4539 [Burkholderiales bacterium JOSHI_001]|nr:hypothetical protein BurJ1DRAFT_4539 [Burkholderiales bacterium JOSHI_001]
MSDATSFAKLVPGFDFLQGLVKNAGAALPSVGQWIAPTLNPEELEKRIEELRTVQFWLEQNARMLGATIQALEVQRMTLSTLKTMNVSMGELRDSLTLRVPEKAAAASEPEVETDVEDDDEPAPAPAPARKKPAAKKAAPAGSDTALPAGVVDPMQWWGALTKQFTQLAAGAMKDGATDAARNLAGAMVKQSFDAAGETLKKAAAVPGAVAKTAAGVARGAAKTGSRARKTVRKSR